MDLLHDSDESDSEDSSSEPFEFFTATTSLLSMCAADDVIVSGRLLPFVAPPPPPRPEKSGYRKLISRSRRGSDPDPDPIRAPARPRWYLLVFGSVRVPAAPMGMREMRIRQRRRGGGRREDAAEWGPWKLLRTLTCKGMEAVIVS